MKLSKNELKKLDCGKFYQILDKTNPEYKVELKKAVDLTDEEYECVSSIIDNDMRIKEQISLTREVFGKSAFLDFSII